MIEILFSDPVFQFGIFGTIVGTIAVLLVLRSQVQSHPVAVARGTRLSLTLGVLNVLLVSGWSGWNALSAQELQNTGPTFTASSPGTEASPSAGSLAAPTETPSPTPTPSLSRSIIQVLTTFCQDLNARDYSIAWNIFAVSWQCPHTYAAVVAD